MTSPCLRWDGRRAKTHVATGEVGEETVYTTIIQAGSMVKNFVLSMKTTVSGGPGQGVLLLVNHPLLEREL